MAGLTVTPSPAGFALNAATASAPRDWDRNAMLLLFADAASSKSLNTTAGAIVAATPTLLDAGVVALTLNS